MRHVAWAALRGERDEGHGGGMSEGGAGVQREQGGGGRRQEDARLDASDGRAGCSVRPPNIVVVALDGLGRRPRVKCRCNSSHIYYKTYERLNSENLEIL